MGTGLLMLTFETFLARSAAAAAAGSLGGHIFVQTVYSARVELWGDQEDCGYTGVIRICNGEKKEKEEGKKKKNPVEKMFFFFFCDVWNFNFF